MFGIDRQNKPIEKTTPVTCGPCEQSIHRWCQPDHTHMIGKGARRANGRAVNAAFARLRHSAFGSLAPRAQLNAMIVIFQLNRDNPAACTTLTRAIGQISATQAATRCQQRKSFKNIGFACAILARQRNHISLDSKIERGIRAEI
jgi:hypothetical protein